MVLLHLLLFWKVFFRKPTFNGLYTPFGSPVSGGQKPQGRRGKPPSGAQNRYAIRLAGHQSPRQIVRDGTALYKLTQLSNTLRVYYETEPQNVRIPYILKFLSSEELT